MAIQPLLIFAKDCGALAHSDYVDVVIGKLVRNHAFINVSADDLVALARRDTGKVAAGVVAAFNTFRSRNVDLSSTVKVCARFLSSIAPLCQPAISAEYFKLALAALQHERPMHANAVHRALAYAMEHGLRDIPRKNAYLYRCEMGALLKPLEPQQQRIRMTPIARAIEELLERFGERMQ